MPTPVVHWEFWSRDPAKVSEFYSKVFGWKIQHIPEIDYRIVDTGAGAGINGGIMKPQDGPMPGNMAFYIDVDDLAAYRRKIVEAGGKIIVEEQEVPGMGKFCLFEDNDKRVLGIWKMGAPAE